MRARVAIVGAGLSGCAAARQLLDGDISDIVVLEASEQPGGRLGVMSIAGVSVDSGAQFIGPSQTSFLKLTAQLGLSTVAMYSDGSDILRHAPGAEHPQLQTFVDALTEVVSAMDPATPWTHPQAEHLESVSVDRWARAIGVTDGDALANISATVESFVGGQSETVSVLWFATFVAGAGGWNEVTQETLADRVDGGAAQITNKIADQLGARIRLNCPVVAVEQDADSVTVTTADGSTITVDQVILACSPSELTRIAFAPELPPARAALNENWTLGGGMKFALAYETPFWRESGLNGTIIPSPSTPVSRIWDNSPDDGVGVGVLMGLASHRRYRNMLPATPAERRAVIEDYVREAFDVEVPATIDYVEKVWADEPWVSGCTAANRPGAILDGWASIRQPIGRIHFAGTEAAESFTGYMEGAVRAGIRAADNVADLVSPK